MIELPYHLVYFESIEEYWKGCEGNQAVRYTYTNPHMSMCRFDFVDIFERLGGQTHQQNSHFRHFFSPFLVFEQKFKTIPFAAPIWPHWQSGIPQNVSELDINVQHFRAYFIGHEEVAWLLQRRQVSKLSNPNFLGLRRGGRQNRLNWKVPSRCKFFFSKIFIKVPKEITTFP